MTRLYRYVAAAFAVCLSATALHAQATINDCEKIQAADAYNQCLAKFGPAGKQQNLQPERPGDIKGGDIKGGGNNAPAGSSTASAPAQQRPAAVSRGRSHGGGTRRSYGRRRMVIHVGRRRR